MTGSGEWRIEPRGDDTGYDVVNGLRWFPSTTRIAAQRTAEYLNAQQQELAEARRERDGLSQIIADKYNEVGHMGEQIVGLLNALKSIKQRAGVVVEETKGQDWFSQNAYAQADSAIRLYETRGIARKDYEALEQRAEAAEKREQQLREALERIRDEAGATNGDDFEQEAMAIIHEALKE